jgi:hypothetical protein
MTTLSYPVEGKNYTSQQFSKIGRRQHQGVDVSMSLSLSSTSNDATVSTGRCNFMGYELEVSDPHVITLAAVTSAKTYVIGVMYDPANEGLDPGGPLAIASFTKGAIAIPAGGAWWPIWEVTRQPSQTLNLATVKLYRVARASLLYADTGVSDPDPAYAQGTQLIVRPSGFKLLHGGQFVDVKDDPGDRTDGITTPADWSAAGTTWRVLNGMVDLDLRGKLLTGSGQTATASGNLNDFRLMTLPTAVRPPRTKTFVGSVSTGTASVPIYGVINSAGEVQITATAPNVTVSAGALVYASVSYLR